METLLKGQVLHTHLVVEAFINEFRNHMRFSAIDGSL